MIRLIKIPELAGCFLGIKKDSLVKIVYHGRKLIQQGDRGAMSAESGNVVGLKGQLSKFSGIIFCLGLSGPEH
jgi:hypothetical protein